MSNLLVKADCQWLRYLERCFDRIRHVVWQPASFLAAIDLNRERFIVDRDRTGSNEDKMLYSPSLRGLKARSIVIQPEYAVNATSRS